MSRDELIRAVVAVPVAALLPLAFSPQSGRMSRALVTAILATAALAPYLDGWRAWVAVAGATLAGFASSARRSALRGLPLLCAGVATALAAGVINLKLAWQGIQDVGGARDVVVVIAGALAAVFVCGVLIAKVLEVFARAIPERDKQGIVHAGRYIGWLERALLYGLFVAGAPDAAALVIAGKSIARFPLFASEEFAEYYLIGSFLSLSIAAGLGASVRAVLGLHPLIPTHL